MARRRHIFLTTIVIGVVAAASPTPGADARRDRAERPSVVGCTGSESGWSRVSEPGPYAMLPGEVVRLLSPHDGADIQIGLIRPDAAGMVPVIAFASPYLFGGLEADDVSRCRPRLTENFVPHGYAVAFIAVRGTADSGGCSDLMGPAERADLDTAVDWLGTQPWSNGNVGMLGVSYDGSTPWEVASMGNPHLKTIVPISGVNDPYHLMYRNGGSEIRGAGALNEAYYEFGFVDYNVTSGRSEQHMVDGAVCPEAWKGFAAAAYSFVTGERDPLGFWAERNLRPGVEANYEGSILLVHGLQDFNVDPGHAYPWVSTLEEEHGLYVKHLLGQWQHAWPDSSSIRRGDWADMLLSWFDRWLKGDLDADLGPRVEVQDSSFRWRAGDAWPPRDAPEVTLYLAPDGHLSETPGEGTVPLTPLDTAPFDCRACTAFMTPRLSRDLHISGMPEISLRATPGGPGGHITAELMEVTWLRPDVHPPAVVYRVPVGTGHIDLRFADGGEAAQPVIPGQPLDLRLALQPMDVIIPAGSSLALVLHQGVSRDRVPQVPTGPILLELDASSTLTFLSPTPNDDDFFEPPTGS